MTDTIQTLQNTHIAVILTNLGTPDEPTPTAVKTFLREFLSDTRVIEIPMFIWKIILNLAVLPRRSDKVAHAYESIWYHDGDYSDSPIRKTLVDQSIALETRLQDFFQESYPEQQTQVTVHPAMTYGNPAMIDVFNKLRQQGVEKFVVLPLYPQYSSTSTGAVYDAVSKWSMKQRDLPSISINKDYYTHPLYIKALANSIRRFQDEHGKPDKLLMSFHGIPIPFEEKGDPYPTQCRTTAWLLAEELELDEDEWLCSFQSRFGLQEWVKPYTDKTLEKWSEEGKVKSIQIISPAFSSDCLETLEELAIENKKIFLGGQGENNSTGKTYAYIPALNAEEDHIDLIEALAIPLVEGWIRR